LVAFASLAACGAPRPAPTASPFRAACADDAVWNGRACIPQAPARAELAAASAALTALDVDAARAALDRVDHTAPLAHGAHVQLWEQRGIAAAYTDDVPAAKAAFAMLLALDPAHFLSYTLSPKATFVFEAVRAQAARDAPTLDVSWPRGGKVGEPVPIDVELVDDPRHLLATATVFVRARGEHTWRAADVALGGAGAHRVVVPPIHARAATSLELYVRGEDARGNEVLAWAEPARPREIPLRYEPPTPWYRKWWVYAVAGSVAALGTGVAVYELTLAPPEDVGGTITVAR
jgi:hypothetical protein